MRSAGVLALVCLCAGPLCPAQDAPAPLSNTRQQLQTLKKDQAAEKSGANDQNLKAAPASSDLAGGMNLAAPLNPNEREKPEKSDARKNWLVDGFEKLDPKAARTRPGDKPAEEKPLDPKDPDYFLKVYERQRATNEAKRLQQERLEDPDRADGARGTGNDPFAPFLASWLAGSPVKDIVRETAGANSSGSRSSRPDPSRLSEIEGRANQVAPPVASALNLAPRSTADAATSNPFVQALGLGPDAGASSVTARPAVAVPPVNSPPPATRSEFSLPPPVRPMAPTRPANATDENQKYFPQLKKF
jgi:hypothetical protein